MRKNTKIRALSLLLALLMVLGLLPGTAMAAEGEDAILISTAEELAAFRDRVNSGENTLDVVLTADIELSGDWTALLTVTATLSVDCRSTLLPLIKACLV